MAKIYSIYLTSEENEQMDKLIKELNVPPSHVLRMGIQALYEKIVLLQEPQPTLEKLEKSKEKSRDKMSNLLKELRSGST